MCMLLNHFLVFVHRYVDSKKIKESISYSLLMFFANRARMENYFAHTSLDISKEKIQIVGDLIMNPTIRNGNIRLRLYCTLEIFPINITGF